MTAVEAELEPRRVLIGDLPSEHDCAGCGSTARVWVPVGLASPEPCCRACAARVPQDDAFRESLAAAHSEPVEDVLPPFRRPAASPPQRKASAPVPANLAQRRRCQECPMVASPGGMGLHQKASGHTGWEAVR